MGTAAHRPPRAAWSPIGRRALGYLRPYRRRGVLCLSCVLVSSALGLVPALALRSIIDHLTGHSRSFGPVAGLVALGLGATVAGALIGVLQTYLTISMSEDIVAVVRAQLFERLLAQSIGYFTEQRGGEAISRILNDAGGIDSMMGPTLVGLLSSGVMGVVALAAMVYLNWKLTLLTLVFVPVVALLLRLAGRLLFQARALTQSRFADLTAYLHDALGLSGIMLIKSFARGRHEHAVFHRLNRSLRDAEVRAQMLSSWFGVAFTFLQAIGPAVLLVAGGYLVVHHELGLGSLVAFAVLASRFAGSVQATANGGLTIIGSLALWERVFGVLDHVPDILESPTARPLNAAEGEIRLESVDFRYPGQGRPALADVTIEIPPRSLTALVGPSGAGKTTLSHLVPRFHDPGSGRVLIDGVDIREASFASLGAAVGMVLQDTYLTHDTLRENLRYGRADADDEAIRRACRLANLEAVVEALPEGLDTTVGERGHRLSGGEKQRVAIARAILKDPPILILDEATSHLDSLSEQLVQGAMRRLIGGRTSLVIAHRLSTVLDADQIIVLDRGVVVQRGTHDELMERDGLYRRLYESQFARGSVRSAAGVGEASP